MYLGEEKQTPYLFPNTSKLNEPVPCERIRILVIRKRSNSEFDNGIKSVKAYRCDRAGDGGWGVGWGGREGVEGRGMSFVMWLTADIYSIWEVRGHNNNKKRERNDKMKEWKEKKRNKRKKQEKKEEKKERKEEEKKEEKKERKKERKEKERKNE